MACHRLPTQMDMACEKVLVGIVTTEKISCASNAQLKPNYTGSVVQSSRALKMYNLLNKETELCAVCHPEVVCDSSCVHDLQLLLYIFFQLLVFQLPSALWGTISPVIYLTPTYLIKANTGDWSEVCGSVGSERSKVKIHMQQVYPIYTYG